jgi:hypothetical protein
MIMWSPVNDNVCLMMCNVTFNNISVISWRSDLLVQEGGGPGENHRPIASHWKYLSLTEIVYSFLSDMNVFLMDYNIAYLQVYARSFSFLQEPNVASSFTFWKNTFISDKNEYTISVNFMHLCEFQDWQMTRWFSWQRR